jgi:sugar transferase (PEP-CTERM/EpsH1 system associated)
MRLAPHLLTKYRYPKYHQHVRAYVDEILQTQSVDLLYVDGLAMTQYVQENPKTLAIVDLGDSKTLLFHRMTRMEKRLLRKVALYLETWAISRWERALGKDFALVVMTSKADESFMKKIAPYAPTMSITNGVDSEYFYPSNEQGNPLQLIFTGVMSYGPNEDAVVYFCKDIFPLIKREYPSVQFWIVGQNPFPKVQALSNEPGVHVTGAVDDVRPYVHSAGIFVSPLRYGAGIKNKILAAMAMQKPVVATSLSLDGIEAHAGEEVLVADTPVGFAEEVCRLLKDASLTRRLGENGHKLVIERYSWKSRAEMLEAAIDRVVGKKDCRK